MRKILLACMLLLQGKLIILGQCDITLRPVDNSSIAYKTRGQRCEGVYIASVSAPSMEIVGFTTGILSYKLETNEVIQIKNSTGVTMFIRSSPLALNTYYRMDATIPAGGTLRWEVRDVLNNLQISSNQLGVYGWTGTENEKTYLPVRPVSSSYNTSDNNIYLVIRTSSRVQEATYRYGLTGGNFGSYENIASSDTNRPMFIELPKNLKGRYTIEVSAKLESTNEWLIREYKLFIK